MSKPNPAVTGQPVVGEHLSDLNNDPSDQEQTSRVQEQNLNGVRRVYFNPPDWPNRVNKYQPNTLVPTRAVLSPGADASATGFNTYAAQDLNNVRSEVLSAPALGGDPGTVPTVTAGTSSITAAGLSTAYSVLNNIIATLDVYDGWWDGSNLCARSCQVSCQVGCQVACQACNGGTCHDQKCGVH